MNTATEHNGCRTCGVRSLEETGVARFKCVRFPVWSCPRCGRELISRTYPQETGRLSAPAETGRKRGRKRWACPVRRANA